MSSRQIGTSHQQIHEIFKSLYKSCKSRKNTHFMLNLFFSSEWQFSIVNDKYENFMPNLCRKQFIYEFINIRIWCNHYKNDSEN